MEHEHTIAAIDRTILKQALDAVMTSASADDTRPHLSGVLLETDPKAGLLRFVSTDGHRLTKLETAANPEFEVKAGSVLLPYRDVKALIGVLRSKGPAASYPEPFAIRVNDGRVGFHGVIDGSVTEIKAADENFPPYEKVIPDYDAKPARETCSSIGWNAKYMADVAKVAKFAGNTNSGGVKVTLGGDRDPVRIDMSNGDATAVVVIMPMRI